MRDHQVDPGNDPISLIYSGFFTQQRRLSTHHRVNMCMCEEKHSPVVYTHNHSTPAYVTLHLYVISTSLHPPPTPNPSTHTHTHTQHHDSASVSLGICCQKRAVCGRCWSHPHHVSEKYLGWSSEGHFVYAHVRSNRCSRRWPESWQNIDDSRWKPGLSKQ